MDWKSLRQIGDEMVSCDESCARISNHPSKGVLPRCLFLEEGSGSIGAVIIGLNPGISSKAERSFYIENGATYDSTLKFWDSQVRSKVKYYTKLRGFLKQAGCEGTLLWTELAKCENEPGFSGALPIQTYRTCAHLYLKRELELIPKEWAVFAVGREAYNASAYLLADRSVIGVPHPTGSRGQFANICPGGNIAKSVKDTITEVLKSKTPMTTWLDAKDESRN